MAYELGVGSLKELHGVHPKMVAVARRTIQITEQDFSVHDGLRTKTEQAEYVRRGVSKTLDSMHLEQADGFGHAMDLVPYINGKLRWEWMPCCQIASAVRLAALELNVPITWGGVWDIPLMKLPAKPEELFDAVQGYVARRQALGKKAFIDGPHYQLIS